MSAWKANFFSKKNMGASFWLEENKQNLRAAIGKLPGDSLVTPQPPISLIYFWCFRWTGPPFEKKNKSTFKGLSCHGMACLEESSWFWDQASSIWPKNQQGQNWRVFEVFQ